MAHEGFQVLCGCTCQKCGSQVILEGFEDADGSHYCRSCDDYVSVNRSNMRSTSMHHPTRVQQRQSRIDRARSRGEID